MKAYLEQAYNINKLREELSNSNSTFYFLYTNEKLSGYLKLNEYKAQTDIYDPQCLEIERIYVTKEFQGKGLGSFLIKKAIDIANIRKKSYVWLGVWERNHKAILFYKKKGFYVIGKHSFFMGEEEQTDFIMRKDLILST
jgi:ribosomal protein S18 acetylase RimI-like enzyme